MHQCTVIKICWIVLSHKLQWIKTPPNGLWLFLIDYFYQMQDIISPHCLILTSVVWEIHRYHQKRPTQFSENAAAKKMSHKSNARTLPDVLLGPCYPK